MVYSSLFILRLITLKCLGQHESTERAIALPLALALALAAAAVSRLTNMLKFYVKVLMDLVFIWYNYRYWSKIILSPIHTLLKVTDLEILC